MLFLMPYLMHEHVQYTFWQFAGLEGSGVHRYNATFFLEMGVSANLPQGQIVQCSKNCKKMTVQLKKNTEQVWLVWKGFQESLFSKKKKTPTWQHCLHLQGCI